MLTYVQMQVNISLCVDPEIGNAPQSYWNPLEYNVYFVSSEKKPQIEMMRSTS